MIMKKHMKKYQENVCSRVKKILLMAEEQDLYEESFEISCLTNGNLNCVVPGCKMPCLSSVIVVFFLFFFLFFFFVLLLCLEVWEPVDWM